jgi:hypothetical protein
MRAQLALGDVEDGFLRGSKRPQLAAQARAAGAAPAASAAAPTAAARAAPPGGSGAGGQGAAPDPAWETYQGIRPVLTYSAYLLVNIDGKRVKALVCHTQDQSAAVQACTRALTAARKPPQPPESDVSRHDQDDPSIPGLAGALLGLCGA